MCTRCEGSPVSASALRTNGPPMRDPAAAPAAARAPLMNPRREKFMAALSVREELAGGENRSTDVGPAASGVGLRAQLVDREVTAGVDFFGGWRTAPGLPHERRALRFRG